MIVVGAVGSKANPSSAEINGVVASLILFFVFVRVSYQTNCFLIGSEIGGVKLRKKSELKLEMTERLTVTALAFAISIDIIAAVIWTIAVPYMLARLGAKVGYIVGDPDKAYEHS